MSSYTTLLTVINGLPLGAAATVQNQKPKKMGQNFGLFFHTGDDASSIWGRSGEEAWPRMWTPAEPIFMLGGGGSLRHKARNRDILGFF